MGASSNSKKYYHKNAWNLNDSTILWTDCLNNYFEVDIVSNRVQGFSYAHHFLLLKGNGPWIG